MIELIRRIAEIAVQEEQKSSSLLLHGEESFDDNRSAGGGASEVNITGNGSNMVFEYFCEVNVVNLLINIATGFSFVGQDRSAEDDFRNQDSLEFIRNESTDTNDAVVSLGSASFESHIEPTNLLFLPKRLPSVRIAIQVLQSISILIQNVKMSTSLYLILSNNKVNDLINLPLDSYAAAETFQQKHASLINHENGHGGSSGELSELTNIFISFLKSLTMKMNPETLQFYLTYPSMSSSSSSVFSSSKDKKSYCMSFISTSPSKQQQVDLNQIKFPLYERALQFCNPEEDPFVRVTAMNLCLNTLRLATDGDESATDSHNEEQRNEALHEQNANNEVKDTNINNAAELDTDKSNDENRPDRRKNPGTTSKLPFFERAAVCHYVCQPSRVQSLSAGIFTRLASLCGKVEETIRTLDRIDRALSACFTTVDKYNKEYSGDKSSTDKTGPINTEEVQKKIKLLQSERVKLVKHFLGDTVSDFQDELFLLEDVLKVGLVPLNEQIIEMMFPTVIYPLVLTPLHNFIKQNKRQPTEEGGATEPNPFSDRFEKHMSRPVSRGASSSETDSSLAKSALFMIASIYHYITHKELLQLLMTALLHPLTPEISNAYTIVKNHPDIMVQDAHRCSRIKTDALNQNEGGSLYTYGRENIKNDLGKVTSKGFLRHDCVFVFCPILSDIFEWSMVGSLPNGVPKHLTPNRYRRTLLSCLSGTDGMAELQALAVYAIDAIVSTMRDEVLDCIIFGTKILDEVEFRSSTPVTSDESLASDTASAVSASDDFAFSATVSQHMVEFIASMCVGVITAAISYDGKF